MAVGRRGKDDGAARDEDLQHIETWPRRIAEIDEQYYNPKGPAVHADRCIAGERPSPKQMKACSKREMWLPTEFALAVDSTITRSRGQNLDKPRAERITLIDSEPNTGKSTALERSILRRADSGWQAGTYVDEETMRRPVVYVRLGSTSGPADLMKAIMAGYGRTDPSGTVDSFITWIAAMARLTETQVIVLDDLHMTAGPRVADVTNTIRNLMAELSPTTLVVAGVHLEEAPVLNNPPHRGYFADEQILERADWVHGRDYQFSPAKWRWLLRTLSAQVHLPDGSEASDVFTSRETCFAMGAATGAAIGGAASVIDLAVDDVFDTGQDFKEALAVRIGLARLERDRRLERKKALGQSRGRRRG